jgi:alpha,alpha-trehalose-phosphate synthase [UDP-forming]
MASSDPLLVVSHRIPVDVTRAPHGARVTRIDRLAVAIDGVMDERRGAWLGWAPPLGDEILEPTTTGLGYPFRTVRLKEPEVASFHAGFANQVLWPLCHMFPSRCRFQPALWAAYRSANERFATAVRSATAPGQRIWVNDFHLCLVPGMLRAADVAARLGVFWHLPFPPPALFGICSWRADLLAGVLGADLIGFQTEDDVRNFLDCVVHFLDLRVAGDPPRVCLPSREVRVVALPVGIDARRFAEQAEDASVREHATRLREALGAQVVLMGVDRLDYTKGIAERLLGFERFLDRNPGWRRRVSLVQISVPPQFRVSDYGEMRHRIEETVGRIVGRFSYEGRSPLTYVYTALNHEQLAAYYVAADVALVTPLRDGMNLVAKEYVACHPEGTGMLVLSEFAGAARELGEALLVNPYDPEAMGRQIDAALGMPPEERRRRMVALGAKVAAHDVRWWCRTFLSLLDA